MTIFLVIMAVAGLFTVAALVGNGCVNTEATRSGWKGQMGSWWNPQKSREQQALQNKRDREHVK